MIYIFMELPPLPPLSPLYSRRKIGDRDAFLFQISVEGAVDHFNPRHHVFAWIGKFADHKNLRFWRSYRYPSEHKPPMSFRLKAGVDAG